MAVEMNKSSSVRLTPVQEIKLAKPATELYVGQVLKTVVVTALANDQVMININGQNLNAQSSHHFNAGELLEVKVIANQGETILEVQTKDPAISVLQNALLQTLPKQAPPTQLFQTLNQLLESGKMTDQINQQIRNLLNSVTPVTQLTQQMAQAISHSGVFLEYLLSNSQEAQTAKRVKLDFKAQCLQLLGSLPDIKNNQPLPTMVESILLEQDPLPLPGAIPQPLRKEALLDLSELSPESLVHILKNQIGQVIARITASQINHLSHHQDNGYVIMLDLPIKTSDRQVDVIPLMIKQQKAAPMLPSRWSISFAVSLSQLGDMQTTIAMSSDSIDLKINAEKRSTLDLLKSYEPQMVTVLQGLGLKLHDLNLQEGLEHNQIDVANLRLLDLRI